MQTASRGEKKKQKRWPLVLKQDQELTTPTPTTSVTTTSVTQFSTVTSGDTQSVWIARLLPVISCAISLEAATWCSVERSKVLNWLTNILSTLKLIAKPY